MSEALRRGTLLRWTGWFALANSFVFGLVSLRYFGGSAPVDSALAWVYLVAVYIGHHVLLTTVPLFLLATPLILVWPRRRAVTVLAVVLFAGMIALMMLDSLLWSQSHFHINALTMKILGWQSWVFAGFIFALGLFFESMLARAVWNWVRKPKRRRGPLVGAFCGLMVLLSQGIHAWADAAYYVPVTGLGQMLPVYKGVTAKSFMTKTGLVDIKASREREMARRMSSGLASASERLLKYPQNPLQCDGGDGLNLLFLIVDSMRGKALTPELAPNISRFAAERAVNFRNHYSGGNSSRMGMFSMFYGLPPGYWSSFSSLQRPTVLMDELQRQEYQLGLFSSATLVRPVVLDRTAFANVHPLRLYTEPLSDPPWKRDETLVGEWFDWLEARDPERPFFGFLFFDATMTRKPPPDYPQTFAPEGPGELAERYANYRTAVHFNDGLVAQVLEDLERRGLMDRTVVLISSDHGEEFGESGEAFRVHGSGYTRYQLVVPMVVRWPGGPEGEERDYRTSHYDVVPTLMQDLLGCSNAVSDYSVGGNLFDGESWDWMVAGSYYNYAVLEPDQVTVTFPNGLFEVRDPDYRLLREPAFRGDVLEAVSEQNARFFDD